MLNHKAKSPIIVALDFTEQELALTLVRQLDPQLCQLKVGIGMFTKFGPSLIKELQALGYPIFLDLKFHDIPHQVALACTAAAELGVWMLSIHTLGGTEMMIAAHNAIATFASKPLLMGITLLTSMSVDNIHEIGLTGKVEANVKHLAQLAAQAKLDGVVCSAQEAASLRQLLPAAFCLVTPGIRLEAKTVDDQKRILTPQAAMVAGANYLVIGRPITQAKHPRAILEKIYQEVVK